MATITIPGMFLTGTHAARPAATAVGKGSLYACSDHKLIYQSDGATWSTWIDASGSGGTASNLASARYLRTSADYTLTGSTSFATVDNTNLSLTITTGVRPVLIVVSASGASNNVAGTTFLDVELDGARLGGATAGLMMSQQAVAAEVQNMSFSFITADLTAASHTFKLMWAISNAAHTSTLRGTDPPLLFAVAELYA